MQPAFRQTKDMDITSTSVTPCWFSASRPLKINADKTLYQCLSISHAQARCRAKSSAIPTCAWVTRP